MVVTHVPSGINSRRGFEDPGSARNIDAKIYVLPAGALEVNELTVIWGLPPANASLVRMRKVRAPECK